MGLLMRSKNNQRLNNLCIQHEKMLLGNDGIREIVASAQGNAPLRYIKTHPNRMPDYDSFSSPSLNPAQTTFFSDVKIDYIILFVDAAHEYLIFPPNHPIPTLTIEYFYSLSPMFKTYKEISYYLNLHKNSFKL
jgi:hypothetical protein